MKRFRLALILLVLTVTSAYAQDTGRIDGRVVNATGDEVGGVVVTIDELSRAELTDAHGAFHFDRVPPGTYSLTYTAGERVERDGGIEVSAGETTELRKQVDWTMTFAESITVQSVSRRAERIVEAPAAVSVVTEEELALISPTGQLPKALESAPGVDFTQSGLYDFNFSARGFNSTLNRRILTLIDGRDPSVPFLGAQEWAALSYPLDEMAAVELVRGPGSALYGANAFNGVLNMITKQPRFTEGGKVQLSGGDLATMRVDFRQAGELGAGWYYRVLGGWQESDDFTRSRNATREYGIQRDLSAPPCAGGTFNCLPAEAVPLALDEVQIGFAGIRADRYFEGDRALTLEAGGAQLEGPVFVTGIGRVQVTDVERPWIRANFSAPRWNLLAYWDARDANEQIALASGAPLYEDSQNVHAELQGNQDFFGGRARVVGGVAWHQQDVDTSNPQGFHTLMAEAKTEEQQAVFGQLDFDATDRLKVVLASRWDDSTLHDAQLSPKASVVYSLATNHSLRASYNEAFQVPNYSEFFLRAPAGRPVNLSPIETALAPFLGGVPLGFGSIPILALGNENLQVEEITSYEIGYSGIFGGKLYATVDYYENAVENFVTDLLPGVNPTFAPYQPPAVLPAQVRAILLQTLQQNLPPAVFAGFTNLAGGAPAIVFSYTNAGEVDTRGVELAFNYYVNQNWVLDANYAWFDFDVKSQALGDRLLPNAPSDKYNLGVTYRHPSFDASLKYRWVDGFDWAAGVFFGHVPSYGLLNLAANYTLAENWTIGLNVSNLADDEHFESFGGDLLTRRALGYVSYRW
ncbi:MAG: TonB-dependent receptor [Thermoanaerobaculia bacterium]